MDQVLKQAEVLGELILESEAYKTMRQAESAVMRDEAATRLIAELSEKRRQVEDILASSDMDHQALAGAGQALEEMERQVNELPLVKAMQEARSAFTQMMQNVNQIIRFVVTGEMEESGGCGGSCESCGGCHH